MNVAFVYCCFARIYTLEKSSVHKINIYESDSLFLAILRKQISMWFKKKKEIKFNENEKFKIK